MGSRPGESESEGGADTNLESRRLSGDGRVENALQTRNLESRRSLAAGRANLKQKRPRHEFGITAVLGGRAGKLESESGADTTLESRRFLAVGRANLKTKSVQIRIRNQRGPWRSGGQM